MDYNHKEEAFVTTLTLYNAKKMNSFTSRCTLIAVLIARLQNWGPAKPCSAPPSKRTGMS